MTGVAGWRPPLLRMLTLLLLTGLLWAPSPAAAAGTVVPKPTVRDKCPVCGMFVAKYPDWLTAIRLGDGSHVYFDGAKDLFKYLQNPQRFGPAGKGGDFRALWVLDYYRLVWIDGRKAWYVLGSDVYGPMGRELIPLETEAEAREFLRDHRGTRLLRFPDVTPEVIKGLD